MGSPRAGSTSELSMHKRPPAEASRGRLRRSRLATRHAWLNQVLHPEAQTLESIINPDLGRTPSLFDQRSPAVWATHINVPVFLVGALEDEQVGPQWPALITALHGDKDVFVTMMNGTHIDSLGPETITRWLEFLDIFVAQRVPTPAPALSLIAPAVYSNATGGAKEIPIPSIRFTNEPNVATAEAAFVANDPHVRVLFDYGGGNLGPGALQSAFEAGFSTWPPEGTVTTYYLGADGSLSTTVGSTGQSVSFWPNPQSARKLIWLPVTRGQRCLTTTGRSYRQRTGSHSRLRRSLRTRRSSEQRASTSNSSRRRP